MGVSCQFFLTVTQEMPLAKHNLPEAQKRENEVHTMTKRTIHMNAQTVKEELKQRNRNDMF